MNRNPKTDEQLATLASHLTSRRPAILQVWRKSVDNDPELTAPSSLPRTQFNDHIPELLNAFEQRLHVWPSSEGAASKQQRKEEAASHGLQRWQQGYRLREVTREWGHLHLCLVDELASYSTAHPDLEPGVMPTAWRALAELCSQGVSESTTQYFESGKGRSRRVTSETWNKRWRKCANWSDGVPHFSGRPRTICAAMSGL